VLRIDSAELAWGPCYWDVSASDWHEGNSTRVCNGLPIYIISLPHGTVVGVYPYQTNCNGETVDSGAQ
jgi:hypothetical protein